MLLEELRALTEEVRRLRNSAAEMYQVCYDSLHDDQTATFLRLKEAERLLEERRGKG